MFNIKELMKDNDSFNILYTNAGNGDGCIELHSWIIEIVGDYKKKQSSMCSCLNL